MSHRFHLSVVLLAGCLSRADENTLRISDSETAANNWITRNSLERLSIKELSIAAPNDNVTYSAVFLHRREDKRFALLAFDDKGNLVSIQDVSDKDNTGLSFKSWQWESVEFINLSPGATVEGKTVKTK